MKKNINAVKGFSLVEMMIGIAIVGIFFAAVAGVFLIIGRGVMNTRTRTVATNLAQERIEDLKNASYSRLRVTSAGDLSTYGYDNTFYPPETGILVGDLLYERRVVIKRVQENSSGDLIEMSPDASDTGIKKISVSIHWNENSVPNFLTLSNMRNDPNRRPMDGTIQGIVKDNFNVPVEGADVMIVDNQNWDATTDNTGSYSIKVPTGTYQVRASRDGYFSSTSGNLDVAGNTNCNLIITKMGVGKINGYVFYNDHPVISKVISSSMTIYGENIEWIELYNPSTFTFLIDSNFVIDVVADDGTHTHIRTTATPPLTIVNPNLLPNHYALIASTPVVAFASQLIAADAYYNGNLIDESADKRGAIIATFYDNATLKRDTLGWTNSFGVSPDHYELSPLKSSHGLDAGAVHLRFSRPGVYSTGKGNAYDSNDNSKNFFANLGGGFYRPNNTSVIAAPTCGTPVYGATITCDDGISDFATSTLVVDGSGRQLALFELLNVATGSWTVSAFSNGLYTELSGANVVNNGDVISVANASTTPAWPETNCNYIFLSSGATYGMVTGKVLSSGAGVSGIKIEAGIPSVLTNAVGNYLIALEPGSYNLTANPDNQDTSYTSQSISTVPVSAGIITSGINFDISPGGSIGARVISNANDPLEDVLVVAYDFNGIEAASALTASDGRVTIQNLATTGNTYSVKPILESGESSTPSSRAVSVSAGSIRWTDTAGYFSSFTVTSAYGKFKGSVTNNGDPIYTGVLILATTSTIAGDPVDIDGAFRGAGSLYYGTASRSDGQYELEVRGGATYNLYAWYTTLSATFVPGTVKKSQLNKTVAAGGSTTVDFSWP